MTLAAPTVEKTTLQRSVGLGHLAAKFIDGKTRIGQLYQDGCAKIRVPRLTQEGLEAILINTSGGLTGGDRVAWKVEAARGAQLNVTTQACEKAYRSQSGHADVEIEISVGSNAYLAWLPQETIIFEGSALRRRLNVQMDADAKLLMVEPVILGRSGMGETVTSGAFSDQWRVHRNGQLIHAEATRFDNDYVLANSAHAGLDGHRAFATIMYFGGDAEKFANRFSDVTPSDDGALLGHSYWRDKFAVRLMARDGYVLRQKLIPILNALHVGGLPRIWTS